MFKLPPRDTVRTPSAQAAEAGRPRRPGPRAGRENRQAPRGGSTALRAGSPCLPEPPGRGCPSTGPQQLESATAVAPAPPWEDMATCQAVVFQSTRVRGVWNGPLPPARADRLGGTHHGEDLGPARSRRSTSGHCGWRDSLAGPASHTPAPQPSRQPLGFSCRKARTRGLPLHSPGTGHVQNSQVQMASPWPLPGQRAGRGFSEG